MLDRANTDNWLKTQYRVHTHTYVYVVPTTDRSYRTIDQRTATISTGRNPKQ